MLNERVKTKISQQTKEGEKIALFLMYIILMYFPLKGRIEVGAFSGQ